MPDQDLDTATLGGGCFWCLEAAFQQLRGITRVQSGYAGGDTPDPSYEAVCAGTTGHAEVVQVEFDPAAITYRDLLDVFFTIHDPTQLNRQGNDVGTQYRSAIFYTDEAQRREADAAKARAEASGRWKRPVVTEIAPLGNYYRAEEYHQEYFEKNPYQGYCQVVIAPKLSKFRKRYQERLKT